MLPSRGASKLELSDIGRLIESQAALEPRDRSLNTLKMLRQNSLGLPLYQQTLRLSIETCIDLDQYDELEYMLRAYHEGVLPSKAMHVATLLMYDPHRALELATDLEDSNVLKFTEFLLCGDIQAVSFAHVKDQRLRKLLRRAAAQLEPKTRSVLNPGVSAGSRVKCADFLDVWFGADP